jgi:hypothetical protein
MSTEKKTPTPLEKDLLRRYEQAVGTLVRHMMVEAERRAEMLIAGEPVVALDLKVNQATTKRKKRSERSERTHLVGAKGMTRCGHMKLSASRTSSEKAFPSSVDPCGTCARVSGVKLK